MRRSVPLQPPDGLAVGLGLGVGVGVETGVGVGVAGGGRAVDEYRNALGVGISPLSPH